MSAKVKYKTLYKYVSTEYLVDILQNERLFLSDVQRFNDPFELIYIDKLEGTTKLISGLHILCLTNSRSKKLMWSHYADSHKGVCLAVQVPLEYVFPICYTRKRLYSDSVLNDLIYEAPKIKQSIKEVMCTLPDRKKAAYIKDKKWFDEREYRIVLDEEEIANCKYVEVDKNLLFYKVKIVRIYLGVNFNNGEESKAKEVLQLCKSKKIEVKEMELSKSNYSICPRS